MKDLTWVFRFPACDDLFPGLALIHLSAKTANRLLPYICVVKHVASRRSMSHIIGNVRPIEYQQSRNFELNSFGLK